MNTIENRDTSDVLISLGKIFIIISFLIPALSLILRALDYEILQKYSFDQDVMNPASAICFILQSIAIWTIRDKDASHKTRILFNTICILIILIGIARLITGMLELPLYLDEILFRKQILTQENPKGGVDINLMSPTTGIILITLGSSILLTNYGSAKIYKIAQFLNYLIILGALLSLYGYVYQIKYLNSYEKFAPIPMYNTLTIFFQAAGILLLRPYKGSMATLVGEHPAQIIILRIVALCMPLLLGMLIETGKDKDLFGKEFGTALYASATFAISMFLLGWKSNIQFKVRRTRIVTRDRIKKSQEFLKQILEISPTIINIVNLESEKFSFTNQSSRNNYRIANESLVEKKYFEAMKKITYEDDTDSALKRFDKFKKLKKGEHNTLTYRIYNKDKKVTWVHSIANGYSYENGEIKSVIINAVDITKQKQLQIQLETKTKEIEKNNKKLHKINSELEDIRNNLEAKVRKHIEDLKHSEKACKDFFKNSFEGITLIGFKDIKGIDISLDTEEQLKLLRKHAYIKDANEKIVQIHGYESADEIIGMSLESFMKMSPEDKFGISNAFFNSGYKLEKFQTNPVDKNGNQLHLEINIIGVIEDNLLTGAWGTQRKREI